MPSYYDYPEDFLCYQPVLLATAALVSKNWRLYNPFEKKKKEIYKLAFQLHSISTQNAKLFLFSYTFYYYFFF